MKRSVEVRLTILGSAFSLLLACGSALAQQAYPARPIRVINPTAAGGVADGMVRALGQAFADRTGQNFVVENRPGANAIIAAEACAKAPPDGYTVCVLTNTTISLSPYLYAKLPYDAGTSFVPITELAVGQQVLVVHPSIPAGSFDELVAYSKRDPGKINYGSSGIGSNTHLTMERLKLLTGASFTHVPFKGASAAPLAFASGDVHVMYLIIGNPGVLEQIRTGRSKALLVSGGTRSPLIPAVPTFAEAGFPGVDAPTWFGMFAPAGTPGNLVAKLSGELTAILRSPAFRDRFLAPFGFSAVGGTPEEFARFIAEDRKRGAELVRSSGARADEK